MVQKDPPRIRILCVDDSTYNIFLMKELFKNMESTNSILKIELESALHG
jgi:hypothetical protein